MLKLRHVLFAKSEYASLTGVNASMQDLDNMTYVSGEELRRVTLNAAPRYDMIRLWGGGEGGEGDGRGREGGEREEGKGDRRGVRTRGKRDKEKGKGKGEPAKTYFEIQAKGLEKKVQRSETKISERTAACEARLKDHYSKRHICGCQTIYVAK